VAVGLLLKISGESDVKRPVIISFAVLGAGILLAAVLLLPSGGGDVLPEDGVLRIGYAVEAPYSFITPAGEVSGQSPELARIIAARLGAREIKWRLSEFGSLLSDLEEGRIDVVAAGMFITPERAERVAFSDPIFHVRQALLVARGNPHDLHAYHDALDHPTLRIAALSGAVEVALLRRIGLREEQIYQVPEAGAGLAAVENGLADGLALSSPTLQWMDLRGRLAKAELARPFRQPDPALMGRHGYGAFAFRKADRGLLRAWNAAQSEVLRGPEYARIMSRFGFTHAEYPGDIRAGEVARP
jgi:polar amino acid transport system substrate-binding protein